MDQQGNWGTSKPIVLESILTCPYCGYAQTEGMSLTACLWYYECKGCQRLLKPKAGDCCVFCSYGCVPCPPIQENLESCCSS